MVVLLDNPVIDELLTELRDKDTHPREFRNALRMFGQFSAYEVAKTLNRRVKGVETSLGIAEQNVIADDLILVKVLRAAIPMAQGFIDVFPESSVGFMSAWREKTDDGFKVTTEYSKLAQIDGKVLIVIDPMLATGTSLLGVLDSIKEKPKRLIISCMIAAQKGIDEIEKAYPESEIFVGAVDSELNEKGYIVPGLGDAGDRSFNTPDL